MSVNRATEVWKEIKPFALRDLGLLDAKSKDSGKSGYFIILYDESAKKLRYYSASRDGLNAALAAASSGDVVWLPACTIANSVNSFTPGTEINTGAIIVTSETGQEIGGLTPGQWYAVESWNGYFKLGTFYPQESSKFQLSDGSGFTGFVGQNLIGSSFTISPDFCSFSEIFVGSDSKNYGRTYFLAKTESIWIRVQDDIGAYYDNTGTLSWRLRNATVNAVNVIPSGVEVVGIGENCIIDGSIENNGILTNVKVMGSITGTGSYHAFDSYSTWETNKRIKSDLATGTSPFEIMSTTLNINLNADLLDGYHAEELPVGGHAISHENGGTDALKLDDLAAPDDNTDLDASIAKHGLMKKFPGGTTNFLREDGTFVPPPGIGIGDGAPNDAKYITAESVSALSNEIVRPHLANYFQETPPSSPNSKDDEFSTGTLDAKWTTVGTFTEKEVTSFPGYLNLSIDGAVSNAQASIYQSPPSLPFTIETKIICMATLDFAYGGIHIWQDASNQAFFGFIHSTTLNWWGQVSGSDKYTIARYYNDYSTGPFFVRVTVPSSIPGTYTVKYSNDGLLWRTVYSGSLNFTPNRIGLVLHPNSASVAQMLVDYFRVTA